MRGMQASRLGSAPAAVIEGKSTLTVLIVQSSESLSFSCNLHLIIVQGVHFLRAVHTSLPAFGFVTPYANWLRCTYQPAGRMVAFFMAFLRQAGDYRSSSANYESRTKGPPGPSSCSGNKQRTQLGFNRMASRLPSLTKSIID